MSDKTRQTCDVDVEVVRHLSMLVLDGALVRALVLLLQALDAEDDLVGGSVGPTFEAASGSSSLQVYRTLRIEARDQFQSTDHLRPFSFWMLL